MVKENWTHCARLHKGTEQQVHCDSQKAVSVLVYLKFTHTRNNLFLKKPTTFKLKILTLKFRADPTFKLKTRTVLFLIRLRNHLGVSHELCLGGV